MPVLDGLHQREMIRDLTMGYAESYILMKVDNAEEVVYLKKFMEDGDKIAVSYMRGKDLDEGRAANAMIALFDQVVINDKLPSSGLIQQGSSILYAGRSIERQFKRGLCQGNTRMNRVLGSQFSSTRAMIQMFKPRVFKELNEIQKEFKAGNYLGGLITDELAGGLYANYKSPAIAWNDKIIGWQPDGEKKVCLMKEFYWLQNKLKDHCEILDLV